ncbi:hypothetical protein AK812_SmicGene41214 [Symbiodinium microadriaticum]|uniref:Uncharacterized protein n=1 Tax=Symbiodinium microadriaticum TaxID=2951 RepID=A0A1Q9C6P3_SYMMI|nr:hypothetical protein AK812_SmicGene41214 [Symbiodinium microadriaticum]
MGGGRRSCGQSIPLVQGAPRAAVARVALADQILYGCDGNHRYPSDRTGLPSPLRGRPPSEEGQDRLCGAAPARRGAPEGLPELLCRLQRSAQPKEWELEWVEILGSDAVAKAPMPKRKHADGMQIAGQAIERLVPRDKLTAFNLIQKILVRIPGWQPALEYSEEVMKRLAPQFAHAQLSQAQELQERDALAFALAAAKTAGIDEGAHELKDLMVDCYEKGMCGKCGLDVALHSG